MPSAAACPATPLHVSTSKPSRCSATFRANCSCPPCIPSGTASTSALLAAPPNTLRLAPTSTTSRAATLAAIFLAAFAPKVRANCGGKPVAAATAPIVPASAIWSVFLPPYSCARSAAISASFLDAPFFTNSSYTASYIAPLAVPTPDAVPSPARVTAGITPVPPVATAAPTNGIAEPAKLAVLSRGE